MFSDAPLALARLGMIENVSWFLMVVGVCLMVAGWLWLVYQNYRMSPVEGILSLLVIPAVFYALYTLEHRHKAIFTSLFLGGFIVGTLGNTLLYSVDLCREDIKCAQPMQFEEATDEQNTEPPDDSESSILELSRWLSAG